MSRHLTSLALLLLAMVAAPVACDAIVAPPHGATLAAPASDEPQDVYAASPRLEQRAAARPLRTPLPCAPAASARRTLPHAESARAPYAGAIGGRVPLYAQLRVLRL